MGEDDINILAQQVADRLPRAHWIKATVALLTVIVPLAFSSGLLWAGFKGYPAISKNDWALVYSYVVIDKEKREKQRERRATEVSDRFHKGEMKDREHDLIVSNISATLESMKRDISFIKKRVR